MRKVLAIIFSAMMATTSINAQNGYDDTKHEIAVSYGALSNSQWVDILEDVTTIIVGATYKDETFVGPISAEYFYRVKNWLGVGAVFAFGQSNQDMYIAGTKEGKATNTYYTLMPAAKFDWLRKKYFGMYSKLAVGATLRRESIDSDKPSGQDYTNSGVHLNWQVSAIGIEAGSPKLRGFVEFGTGEQGIALVGIRSKF